MKKTLLSLALFATALAQAQPPTYYIQHTNSVVTIDGNPAEWSNVMETPVFVEDFNVVPSDPNAKNTVTAKMMWDDNNLYIFYTVLDHDLVSTVSAQDGTIFTSDDIVEMILDFDGGGAPYMEFGTNANNVNYDYAIFCAGEGCGSWSDNLTWDINGLQTATLRNGTLNNGSGDQGYMVEIKMPFTGLATMPNGNFVTPTNNTVWKGNLMSLNYNQNSTMNHPAEYLSYASYPASPISNHQHNYFASFVFKTGNVGLEEVKSSPFSIQTISGSELQVNTERQAAVMICDVLGKVILQDKINTSSHYSLIDLPSGCYVIQVSDGTSMEVKKVIIP